MAANKHIERIGDTDANIRANLDTLQIAVQTDDEQTLVWANDGAARYYYSAPQYYKNAAGVKTYVNVEHNNITAYGNITIDGQDMEVWYDGTDGNIDTSINNASDLQIQCGTDKTLELQETVYDDLFTPFDSARVPASNAPNWEGFQGNLNAYTFAANDFLEMTSELLHGYQEGSDVEIHVHWATNGVDAGNTGVKWEVEYTIANAGTAEDYQFPATTTISAEQAIPANTPDLTNRVLTVGTITGASLLMGAVFKGRIRRIAAAATAPAADPFGLNLGLHYEINTMGSRQRYTK
jgi:hypothetical protein